MSESFSIVPAKLNPAWVVVPVLVLTATTLLVGWLMLRAMSGSTRTTFHARPEGLVIQGDLYGRTIPLEQLRLEEAKAVDLIGEPNLDPQYRRGGTSLPGYQAGWFTLRNGEKALLYVTDRHRVVYIPTTDGYSVLLSVEQPGRLIEALRRQAAR